MVLVHLLIAVHIAHWLVSGKTLAPLELNEVMYTFELGVITAGFIFMALAVAATAIFGRFFCSWGCHILALQDLCAWILKKLRIRPIGIRSRLMLWTPAVVAAYMFVWPQVVRLTQGKPLPRLHLRGDAEGWASFATENFWRNLPGPGVAIATFAVCGFVIVYILGSRAFCAYGCPYGAVFGFVDRFAPGRIRVGGDCTQCGACTAACSSHIRVHEELNRFGTVVNAACLKDLDCISACPQQSLHYGFGRPSLVKVTENDTAVRTRYDFALWEEGVMVVVLVLIITIYRGLYGLVPFFFSIALATIFAYFTVLSIRILRNNEVKLNRWLLKRNGRITSCGAIFVGFVVTGILITIHSAFVRYSDFQGRRYYEMAAESAEHAPWIIDNATRHLERTARIGLITPVRVNAMLSELYLRNGRFDDAHEQVMEVLANKSPDSKLHSELAASLAQFGKFDDAERLYLTSLAASPENAHTHYALAGVYFKTGRTNDAAQCLRSALEYSPEYAEAHFDLGALLVERGALDEAVQHLRWAVEYKPDFADAHYNLGVVLAMKGHLNEAAAEIQVARSQNPTDEKTLEFQQYLESLRNQR